MVPPFDEQEALEECRLMASLLADGFLRLDVQAAEPQNRTRQGVMLGALVCTDGAGRRTVLRTVSGIRHSLRPVEGLTDPGAIYVPPVVAPQAIDDALRANDAEIHRLTARINGCRESRRRTTTPGRRFPFGP